MKIFKLLFIIQFILIAFSLCAPLKRKDSLQKKDFIFKILTGGDHQYWDPFYLFNEKKRGRGWIFSRDSSFKEYKYMNEMRKDLFYGTLIWDEFKFDINGDTILIKNYNDYKFVILKLTKDSLVVKDISEISYTYLDSILLIRSKDQTTIPKEY
jgi:hypothetical protein